MPSTLTSLRDIGFHRALLCAAAIAATLAATACAGPESSNQKPGTTEWPAYGYDAGGSRFSPASQITIDNAHLLQVAWTYRTGETDSTIGPTHAADRARFETTPIVLNDVMYINTPLGRVIALDPASGTEIWRYDAHVDRAIMPGDFASRGVTAWQDPSLDTGTTCALRIYLATVDARLIALDGRTGTPCASFGANGSIDLTKGLRNPPDQSDAEYVETSPPAIIDGLVVIGSSIGDNGRVNKPSGEVRAFDARTGVLKWAFDPVTQDPSDPHYNSWGPNGHSTGAANVWSVMAVDSARDLIFLPTTSPSPDYYGGERIGDNRYANSVVALNGHTGKVVWEFQTVHHDLWDYDNASPPALVTITHDGRKQDVVLEATKTGQLFVLDRDTGKPVFPVAERPVPASDVPGEHSWPTQPFNTVIPPLSPQGVDSSDIWGDTPASLAACRAMTRSLRNDGVYTPPSLQGTIQRPANFGGAAWGGVAFDPKSNLVIAPENRLAVMVQLIDSAKFRREGVSEADSRLDYEYTRMRGTPYVMRRRILLAPDTLPCIKPPFTTLVAVDMSSGAMKWEVPLGDWPLGGKPPWGSIVLGGPIATAGGVVFQAGTLDRQIRAFDIATGHELWHARLPAGARSTPMTYLSAKSGKQYVVVSAGGGDEFGRGDYVTAFALPDSL
jgi:quinoprotein glucose dehydrogenase